MGMKMLRLSISRFLLSKVMINSRPSMVEECRYRPKECRRLASGRTLFFWLQALLPPRFDPFILCFPPSPSVPPALTLRHLAPPPPAIPTPPPPSFPPFPRYFDPVLLVTCTFSRVISTCPSCGTDTSGAAGSCTFSPCHFDLSLLVISSKARNLDPDAKISLSQASSEMTWRRSASPRSNPVPSK